MKKILLYTTIALFTIVNIAYAAYQWRNDGSESSIQGTEAASDIDAASYQHIVEPLDRLHANERTGCKLKYLSAATLTVEAGEIVLSNSAGTARLFQRNTSDTTVTWANIDAGAEAASTRYYVYAYQNTTSTATFSIFISTSSSSPTGATYYARLGSFYNDSSSNIDKVTNDDFNDPVYIENDYGASALYIQQDGVLADSRYGFYLYSNAAQTNSYLAYIFNDNANTDAPTLNVKNDGTGSGIYVNQTGNGYPLTILNTGTLYDIHEATHGAYLHGGVWTDGCKKKYKEDIKEAKSQGIIDKIMALEIVEYSPKGNLEIRHLGPYAEDFSDVFGLGNAEGISAKDMATVAFLAIKELRLEIDSLKERVTALENR